MGNCSPRRIHNQTEFKVYNVDANLAKHSKGTIQITNNKILLYQPDREPIEWPLNGIRRYGCYRDIFLFECGRKCATGEGLFAFKCKKAQRLHDTLQHTLLDGTNLIALPLPSANANVNTDNIKLVDGTASNGNLVSQRSVESGEHVINDGNLATAAAATSTIDNDDVFFHDITSPRTSSNRNNMASSCLANDMPQYVNDIMLRDNNIDDLNVNIDRGNNKQRLSSVVKMPVNIDDQQNSDYGLIREVHGRIFGGNIGNGVIDKNDDRMVYVADSSSGHSSTNNNSAHNSLHNLDYVAPNAIDRGKNDNDANLINDSNNDVSNIVDNQQQQQQRMLLKPVNGNIQQTSVIDYTIISPKETIALQESKINNQQKRLEYIQLSSTMQSNISNNNNNASRINNNNSIFQQI